MTHKHDSVVCNLSNGSRYDDGKGGHVCPLHDAAPKLRDALSNLVREVLESHNGYQRFPEWLDAAEDALAQAEGVTSE